jgi:hypothetical protein
MLIVNVVDKNGCMNCCRFRDNHVDIQRLRRSGKSSVLGCHWTAFHRPSTFYHRCGAEKGKLFERTVTLPLDDSFITSLEEMVETAAGDFEYNSDSDLNLGKIKVVVSIWQDSGWWQIRRQCGGSIHTAAPSVTPQSQGCYVDMRLHPHSYSGRPAGARGVLRAGVVYRLGHASSQSPTCPDSAHCHCRGRRLHTRARVKRLHCVGPLRCPRISSCHGKSALAVAVCFVV